MTVTTPITTPRPDRRRRTGHLDLAVLTDAPDASPSASTSPTLVDGQAACASARAVGIPASAWTPENEADAMPTLLMSICEQCPVWTACLREALRMNDVGYRASTTTSQRRKLFPELVTTSTREVTAPRVTDISGEGERRPRHARGEGSLSRYRRGCRCDECRGHNAAARRRERARAS